MGIFLIVWIGSGIIAFGIYIMLVIIEGRGILVKHLLLLIVYCAVCGPSALMVAITYSIFSVGIIEDISKVFKTLVKFMNTLIIKKRK